MREEVRMLRKDEQSCRDLFWVSWSWVLQEVRRRVIRGFSASVYFLEEWTCVAPFNLIWKRGGIRSFEFGVFWLH